MPVGVWFLFLAHAVEDRRLLVAQRPVQRRQVILQLGQFGRADHQRSDPRTGTQPVERHLRDAGVALAGNLLHHLQGLPGLLAVGDRRGFERRGVRQATTFGKRLIARVFAGEKAPGQRAPDGDADVLIDAERDNLMLQFTRGDIVIALIDAEFLQPKALRDPQRLRQLPGRVVGDPDIANFPGASGCAAGRDPGANAGLHPEYDLR